MSNLDLKVFVVIVTYNGAKWYEKCFSSLVNSIHKLDVIVVDNFSTESPFEMIKSSFNSFHLIELESNFGFAKANNIGIKQALDNGADYVFLLNQDAWIEKDTIEKLLETFNKNPNAGIVSPTHMNGNGSALDKYFSFHASSNFISDAYFGRLKENYKLETMNAAAWLMSADCIKQVGGFDTLLFTHYGEDDNYCQRMKYHNIDIVLNTKSIIYHDREDRDEASYRSSIWKNRNADLYTKVQYGNINVPFNLETHKKRIKRKKLKSLLKGKFDKLQECNKELILFENIQKSRAMNQNGGMVWL